MIYTLDDDIPDSDNGINNSRDDKNYNYDNNENNHMHRKITAFLQRV